MTPKFTVVCERGHSRKLDPTALEHLIQSGEFGCKRCSNDYTLEGSVELVCHICDQTWEVSDLTEAMYAMDTACSHCEHVGDWTEPSYHVPHSWGMLSAQFEWVQRDRGSKSLKRAGRDDYWEGLIHFCTAEQFGAIHESGVIRACRTGYYRKPAVCLTEATAGGWDELKSLHGEFGFVFKKRDILKAGGGPVIYLSQHLIDTQRAHGGFDEKLKPFVNVVRTEYTDPERKRYDYLHEREWRMPADIILRRAKVYGVISGKFGQKTKGWENIFRAKIEYPEVVLEGGDDEDDGLDVEPIDVENSEF
jgi:hypothetical protein